MGMHPPTVLDDAEMATRTHALSSDASGWRRFTAVYLQKGVPLGRYGGARRVYFRNFVQSLRPVFRIWRRRCCPVRRRTRRTYRGCIRRFVHVHCCVSEGGRGGAKTKCRTSACVAAAGQEPRSQKSTKSKTLGRAAYRRRAVENVDSNTPANTQHGRRRGPVGTM